MWWVSGTPGLERHPELGPRPDWLRDDSGDAAWLDSDDPDDARP